MPTVRTLRGTPFTDEERTLVLDAYLAAWEAKEAAEDRWDDAAATKAREDMGYAGEAYRKACPIVAVSRSPFTGEVFESSLDIDGLDGLWWAYEYDYRPYVERPATYFAWTGAMKLDGPVRPWPLKAMIGPEAPFVLPDLLGHPAMRAVVSSVLVGEHIGFPIVYFAQPTPHDIERVDDWGQSWYQYARADGSPDSAHRIEDDDQKDFALGPWLEQGKLLWIAPGDLSLTLRQGTDGCPYLDLPGDHRRQYVQRGKVWFA